MKLWRERFKGKYLQSMLLTMLILIFFVLIAYSITLQQMASRSILTVQEEESEKIVSQVGYNIDLMSGMVESSLLSMYTNQAYSTLLNGDGKDMLSLSRQLNSLKSQTMALEFSNSMIVYNANLNKHYATETRPSAQVTNKDIIDFYLREHPEPLKLYPLYDGDEVVMFAMFVYEQGWRADTPGAFIMTVPTRWLFDGVEMINALGNPHSKAIAIIDEQGQFITARQQGDESIDSAQLKQVVLNQLETQGEAYSHFTRKIDGEKMFVSVMALNNADWQIITYQPYDTLLSNINRLRSSVVLVTILFLGFSIIVSLIVSFRLYEPIRRLYDQARKRNLAQEVKERTFREDELGYISASYRNIWDKYTYTKQNSAKDYHLRSILLESPSLSSAHFSDIIDEYKLSIGLEGPYSLLLLEIDGLRLHKNDQPNWRIFKFATHNIAAEIISEHAMCEVVELKNDQIACILTLPGEESEAEVVARLKEIAAHIQSKIRELYRLDVHATVSRFIVNYKEISAAYEEANVYSKYKVIVDKPAIIAPADVRANEENPDVLFPKELEESLLKSLRQSQWSKAHEAIVTIAACIRGMSYDNMIYSAMHTAQLLKSHVKEINKHRLIPVQIEANELYGSIANMESLAEIETRFHSVVREMSEQADTDGKRKNDILIDSIKQHIEDNYKDLNLNLESVAAMFRMTPAYISRIYKQSESVSVNEYINEVRLENAVRLLRSTELTAGEIMAEVGFGSESYFYRQFKAKYGVTPKQFKFASLPHAHS